MIGNLYGMIVRGVSQYHMESFKKYGKTFQSFGMGTMPEIVTSDPEFIKAVTIKEFKYFQNRQVIWFLVIEHTEFNWFELNKNLFRSMKILTK